jgi:NADPH:quinone reductase-like Zn-dependent oxidoreductase
MKVKNRYQVLNTFLLVILFLFSFLFFLEYNNYDLTFGFPTKSPSTTILVTGGMGNIGISLCQRLTNRGHQVVLVDIEDEVDYN